MDETYKAAVRRLSNILIKETGKFLIRFFGELDDEKQDTAHLIDLVVSAHLSSMFNNMKILSEDNEEMDIVVKEFIENLEAYLKTAKPIQNLESI